MNGKNPFRTKAAEKKASYCCTLQKRALWKFSPTCTQSRSSLTKQLDDHNTYFCEAFTVIFQPSASLSHIVCYKAVFTLDSTAWSKPECNYTPASSFFPPNCTFGFESRVPTKHKEL